MQSLCESVNKVLNTIALYAIKCKPDDLRVPFFPTSFLFTKPLLLSKGKTCDGLKTKREVITMQYILKRVTHSRCVVT